MDTNVFFLGCVLDKLLLLRGASLINPPSKITTKLTGQTNRRVGAHTMYYGWGGGKPGTTHKKPGTTPRFFSRPRPPVRFYTVEALCRYVLFHSTPPFSSSSLIREVHCGKSTQSPAVMQKVRGRHDPHLNPLSSRISPCSSPASLLLHRKILFAQ